MTVTSRKGAAWRTAVAFGVKPKNLKAFGPENAWPMIIVISKTKDYWMLVVDDSICGFGWESLAVEERWGIWPRLSGMSSR